MSSNALQIGPAWQNDTPTFVQNGQVDWVAFGNTLWSTSSAVLQRFASAGVQPVTYGAGLALASQFQLDRVGKQRMHDVLINLRGAGSLGRLLWFGFGVRSFVRVMADTDMGVKCVALCSCLVEIHSEDVSAWILEELWKLYEYPQEYLPSHAQFVALVKACSGILIRTSFSRTMDRMVGPRLDGGRVLPTTSNIGDVAKAIQGLFHISKGTISRISVVGGKEGAFIAVFASWLFNLKVHVEDEAGAVTYEDTYREGSQVAVTYSDNVDLYPLQVLSTTYVLRKTDDLFIRVEDKDQLFLTLRTPWEGCLARVFGAAFGDLIKLPHILGGFLGSAARVYTALAMGESNVAEFERHAFFDFAEAAYGRGFVTAATTIFPELAGASNLLKTMQEATDASLEEAVRTIEQTLLNLSQACKCTRCSPPNTKTEASCLFLMALCIRSMVSAISCTVRDPELLPTIKGIRQIYNNIDTRSWRVTEVSGMKFLCLVLGLRPQSAYETGCVEHLDFLCHPVEIFSGYGYRSDYGRETTVSLERGCCMATVRQGICYYLNCLHCISSQAEVVRMVHILPGHIQMKDRQVNNIYDAPNPSDDTLPALTAIQFDMVREYDPSSMIEEPRADSIKIEAFGLEKATEQDLVVFYTLSMRGEPTVRYRPAYAAYTILRQTGILNCERTLCKTQLAFPCGLIREGWQVNNREVATIRPKSQAHNMCFVWPQMSDVARCMVIYQSSLRNEGVYLRRDECVACSTVTLVQMAPETGLLPYKVVHIL